MKRVILLISLFLTYSLCLQQKYNICNSTVEGYSTCEDGKCCNISTAIEHINKLPEESSVLIHFLSGLFEFSGITHTIEVKNIEFTAEKDAVIGSSGGETLTCIFNFTSSSVDITMKDLKFYQIFQVFICSSGTTTITKITMENILLQNILSAFVIVPDIRDLQVKNTIFEMNIGKEIFFQIESKSTLTCNFNNTVFRDSWNYGAIRSVSAGFSTIKFNNITITHFTKTNLQALFDVEGHGVRIEARNCHIRHNERTFLYTVSRSNHGMQVFFSDNIIEHNFGNYGIVRFETETGDLSSVFLRNVFNKNHVWKSNVIYYSISEGDGIFSITHEGNNFTHNKRMYLELRDGCAIRIRKYKAMPIPYFWMIHYISFDNEYFFDNEAASSYGGAIAVTLPDQGFLSISNSLFDRNRAFGTDDVGSGGAISLYGIHSVIINIRDSTFVNNVATYGGAIFCNSFSQVYMILKNVNFLKNQALNYNSVLSRGGAIYITKLHSTSIEELSNFTLLVENSTFVDNSANVGGAICNIFDTNLQILATFVDSKFHENLALEYGGALMLLSADITINNCEFLGNMVQETSPVNVYCGGAIQTRNSDVKIYGSRFLENKAQDTGGAIFSWFDSFLDISKCLFDGNKAISGLGGAIYIESRELVGLEDNIFKNSKAAFGAGLFMSLRGDGIGEIASYFFDNDAQNSGGGVYVYSGNPTIEKTKIYNNTANNGNDLCSMPFKFKETSRTKTNKINKCHFDQFKGNTYIYICSLDGIYFVDLFDQRLFESTPMDYELTLYFIQENGAIVDEYGLVGSTSNFEIIIYLEYPQKELGIFANLTLSSLLNSYSDKIWLEFDKVSDHHKKNKDDDDNTLKDYYWIIIIVITTTFPLYLLCCFACCICCCWGGYKSYSLFYLDEQKRKKEKKKKEKEFAGYEEL